eukprot:9254357-Alexandrium_andersonii.AAC.1
MLFVSTDVWQPHRQERTHGADQTALTNARPGHTGKTTARADDKGGGPSSSTLGVPRNFALRKRAG